MTTRNQKGISLTFPVYLPDRSFQELFSAVRACSGVSCVVGMSDELPPPPVSKTRASQIALNFAGRVKHQMKDERKQVAWLPCPTASTTASPPGLLGHTPSHPHCPARGSGPRSTRSSRRRQCARWRSSCAGAAELTSCCHSPLTTPARGVYYLTTCYYSPRAATCHSPLTARTLPCAARTRSSPRTRRKATRTASCGGTL